MSPYVYHLDSCCAQAAGTLLREQGGSVDGVAIGREGFGDTVIGKGAGGQPAGSNHARKAMCRVCAATEAEEKDLVASFIDMGDLGVAIEYSLGETLSKSTLKNAMESLGIGTYSVVIMSNLLRGYCKCFVETVDVGVVHRHLPCAIGTEHDSLHESLPSGS